MHQKQQSLENNLLKRAIKNIYLYEKTTHYRYPSIAIRIRVLIKIGILPCFYRQAYEASKKCYNDNSARRTAAGAFPF